ncbi:hypothetical protein KP509_13G006100 [Ceratopteris richardii]|uniref:Secreted protein n=1 Tax=Ceratopteris richardii TaxID=49495 RepID=A0A8T2TIB0_CERRI|nr:hypothetical protein KP509_13G006100 [Ceratopteris richardii]
MRVSFRFLVIVTTHAFAAGVSSPYRIENPIRYTSIFNTTVWPTSHTHIYIYIQKEICKFRRRFSRSSELVIHLGVDLYELNVHV